MVPFPVTLSDR